MVTALVGDDREKAPPVPSLTVDIVICAYTADRWDQLRAAVDSVLGQSRRPSNCIVVIDHNPTLLARARGQLDGAFVVDNDGPAGLAGARNAGLARCSADIVAFLDDDAKAQDTWLEHLVAPYEDPQVVGTGGLVVPNWEGERPRWFPAEFLWVVGCSYTGLAGDGQSIRNAIGASMSFRRSAFLAAGGFTTGLGRTAQLPLGCEETEFSIRARQHQPHSRIVQAESSRVDHFVPKSRTRLRYFVRRCYAEGRSKAQISRLVGRSSALSSERGYATRVLPRGVAANLLHPADGDRWGGAARAAVILLGLTATTMGYGRQALTGIPGKGPSRNPARRSKR